VKPLTRPDRAPIAGLPATVPFTDPPYHFHREQPPFEDLPLEAEGLCTDAAVSFWAAMGKRPARRRWLPTGGCSCG